MTANKTKVPLVPSEVSLRGRIPRRCINQTKVYIVKIEYLSCGEKVMKNF